MRAMRAKGNAAPGAGDGASRGLALCAMICGPSRVAWWRGRPVSGGFGCFAFEKPMFVQDSAEFDVIFEIQRFQHEGVRAKNVGQVDIADVV